MLVTEAALARRFYNRCRSSWRAGLLQLASSLFEFRIFLLWLLCIQLFIYGSSTNGMKLVQGM